MEEATEPSSFAKSSEIQFPVWVKIVSLAGQQKKIPYSQLFKSPELQHVGSNQSAVSDMFVTVALWADSKQLTVPMQTPYKAFKSIRAWNEWLRLPIKVCDLPRSSQLAITIWDLSPFNGDSGHRTPFGGTTFPLFDEDNSLHKGRQKCRIYRHKAADGLSETTTPAIPSTKRRLLGECPEITPEEAELERLEKLLKKHELGEIPRIDWLDREVFRTIEKQRQKAEAARQRVILAKQKEKAARVGQEENHDKSESEKWAAPASGATVETENSDEDDEERFTLFIELPRFDFPVVFSDFEYPISSFYSQSQSSIDSSKINLKPPPEVRFGPGIKNGVGADEGSDSDSNYPLITIYDPEVYQRENPCESKHRRLVRSQRTGILDRDLRPNAKIRDELNAIMMYGPTEELKPEEKDLVWKFRHHLTREKRALTKFVKSVAWQDPSEARQAVQLLPKWTEIDVDDALELLGPTFDNQAVRAYAVDRLRKSSDEELLLYLLQLVQALKFERMASDGSEMEDSSLAKFLVSRATENFQLGNYLHWYLMVECDDTSPSQKKEHRKLFARVEYSFMTALMQRPNGAEMRRTLLRQGELVTILSKISKDMRFSREDRPRKIQKLKNLLADPKNELVHIEPPLPLPLDPSVTIVGVHPDDSNVFKSSLLPLLINFKTSTGGKYPVIFKTGDDLRQDQLVIQIITLMDRLLIQENLNLNLTPYRTLATSPLAGAVQFVPSLSLSAASSKYKGSILAYLRANNPDERAELGVRKDVMTTYIKSCAGYCVITYILGVGDRHLDNLLLAPDGHFFHADFGFILGRDPKPFAPLMKLCKEMVEGMGGTSSQYYKEFKQYCFTAYTTLRKSSNLILNLFSLMVDANIPDIRWEPDKAVFKVQERFHLEMDEEEAIRHFDALIDDSVNAIFPAMIDRLHGLVQGWRA